MVSFSLFSWLGISVLFNVTLFALGFFLFEESWKINSFSPVWKKPRRHWSLGLCVEDV